MTAEELFLQKYGNKITANESWVIRFAEDYSNLVLSKNKLFSAEQIKEMLLMVSPELRKDNNGMYTNPFIFRDLEKWYNEL